VFPFIRNPTSDGPSPCSRLSRPPSTVAISDFSVPVSQTRGFPLAVGYLIAHDGGQEVSRSPRLRRLSAVCMPSARTPAGPLGHWSGNLIPRSRGLSLPFVGISRHPRAFSELNRFTCVTACKLPVLRFTLPSPARSGARTRYLTAYQAAWEGLEPSEQTRLNLAHPSPRRLTVGRQ
jgi:hypothetical protein